MKDLDGKYSYSSEDNGVLHLYRGGEECSDLLSNPLISAIYKIEELEEELKNQTETSKGMQEQITHLERRIASIRGSHRVDVAKLKARIEQVERLKKQNKELQEENEKLVYIGCQYAKCFNHLKKVVKVLKNVYEPMQPACLEEVEQFIKENE